MLYYCIWWPRKKRLKKFLFFVLVYFEKTCSLRCRRIRFKETVSWDRFPKFWQNIYSTTVGLKVPKCEILISWIIMIFMSWSLYNWGTSGLIKTLNFFYRWVRYCNFVFVTACTVYAYYLLPHVQCMFNVCYRLCMLMFCYRMRSVRLQFVTVCLECANRNC